MDSDKINLERDKKNACLLRMGATKKEEEKGKDILNVKKSGMRENETGKKVWKQKYTKHEKRKHKINMHRKIKSKYLCTIWNCVWRR